MRLPDGIELDQAVIDSVVGKMANLREITVAGMSETSPTARDALVGMTTRIVAQSGPQLAGIYLSDLGCTAEQGRILLEALCSNANVSKVQDLSLFRNQAWW